MMVAVVRPGPRSTGVPNRLARSNGDDIDQHEDHADLHPATPAISISYPGFQVGNPGDQAHQKTNHADQPRQT